MTNQTKIAAFDLGTMTGFAVGHDHPGNVMSGWWKLKPGRHESASMRFVKLRQHLDRLHAAYPFEVVVYEEVRKHKGVDAAHIYGGLLAILTAWCEDNGVPYQGVPVGTIKKFATGKGNADKAAVIAAVSLWGFKPENDNEADALALLAWKLMDIGAQAPAGTFG